jgi:plastocyanin
MTPTDTRREGARAADAGLTSVPALGLRVALMLVVIVGATLPAVAGSLVGQVQARGPDDVAAGGAAYQSRRLRFLEKIDYSELRDFVVHVTEVTVPVDTAKPPRATVTQRDGAFVPRILPIVAGTLVEWPNADEIYHNVFSMSETTPFDLGLYKRGEDAKSLLFAKTGRIDVFCSIHSQMSCVVLVLPNPWFAVTDDRGRYVIRDIPPGTYQIRAWHERLPPQIQTVVIPAEGEVRADFTLGVGGQPKP